MGRTISQIYEWLDEVKDPEIPVLSLTDMGIVKSVVLQGDKVNIVITPTFVGCPALDVMKTDIIETLRKKGIDEVAVEVNFREAWTSDAISEKGRTALKSWGLAPPPRSAMFTDLDILEHAICPRCSGTNTEMKTPFGSTLCRSIHYCHDCREGFEQFKPL